MKTGHPVIDPIQTALQESQVPAWLFYDFKGLDPLAVRILQLGSSYHATRRWFYLIPSRGEPVKVVHRIESGMLDHLPGRKLVYLEWQQLHSHLRHILQPFSALAMQYSANNAIPYLSRVDAGTVEWIRSLGVEVVSSADLVQRFDSVWSPEQLEQHRATAQKLTSIAREAFQKAAAEMRGQGETTEYSIQQFILDRFRQEGWVTDSPPIVAANENSADPHYQPDAKRHSKIRQGDFLLIDLWAKPEGPESVYADITWTAIFAEAVPDEHQRIFEIVRRARDRGVQLLEERISSGASVQGWEVDRAVRSVIREAGYEPHFVHRTGHNLGREVHGNGVNFDNLETHDTRLVIAGIACTIEPGIYLDPFGVRSEINVYISAEGPLVTTPAQERILTFPV